MCTIVEDSHLYIKGEDLSQLKGNVLPIIWGALLMSQLIYLVIPQFAEISAEPPEQKMLLILCAVGVSNAMASFAVPHFIKTPDTADPSKVIAPSIIQYALLESCCVLGLVCSFLGASPMYQYGLALVGLGGMLVLFPKQKVKGRI